MRIWICLWVLISAGMVAEEKPVDPKSGFIIDQHWETVRNNCTVCHSASLVTQQRGTRENWLEMIRWMQETQNLWPLTPEVEDQILTYLSTNYGPKASYRRVPIPAELMPTPTSKTKIQNKKPANIGK